MSRFIKRFGTKEVRYQIDIVLNKLHMNVIAPDCYIQVVLKRGDHKSELKNTPMLKDKVAKFDKQILSVPTKLYWDEKNQAFLTKLAELQIYIRHQKTQKSAGKIEFDAAEYATKDIKSQKEQRLISKCPDTTAKLFFEIRVHELGDYSHYNNKEEEDEQQPAATDRTRAKTAITAPSSQQMNSNQRDVSPNIGYISARGQPKDLTEFNDRSVSPISRVDPNNKTVSFQPQQQQQQQQMYNTPMNSNRPMFNINTDEQNRQMQQQQSDRYNTSMNQPNGQVQMQQANNYSTLPSAMRKMPGTGGVSSMQPISQTMINTGINDLSNPNDMRILFKQQKEENASLNARIQELIIENDSLKQQVDNYKNESQRLKSRIATIEGQNLSSSSSTGGGGVSGAQQKAHSDEVKSYEEQIKKLCDEIKVLKTQSLKDSDSERAMKEAKNESEMRIAELNLKFEREKSIFEKKVKDLQMSLEEAESNISELQGEITKKQKDTDYYKALVNRSNREETENEYMLNLQTQLKDLSSRNTQFEKESKKRIADLSEENAKLKKDKELELIDLRRAKTEADHELAKLSRENDLIKKDAKELTNKYSQAKTALQSYLNKEQTDPTSSTVKNKELQVKFEDVNNKLIKLSVERGNIEMERDNLKREIRQREEETQRVKGSIPVLERRLLTAKQMLCDVINVIMMSGDRDMLDYVEPSIVNMDDDSSEQIVMPMTTPLMNSGTYSNSPFTTNLVNSDSSRQYDNGTALSHRSVNNNNNNNNYNQNIF